MLTIVSYPVQILDLVTELSMASHAQSIETTRNAATGE